MTTGPVWNLDDLIEVYRDHLRRTRGLREATLVSYERHVRLFLRTSLGEDPLSLAALQRAHVMAFIASVGERFSVASVGTVCTALRSLFAFLRAEGLCDQTLETAIRGVRCGGCRRSHGF